MPVSIGFFVIVQAIGAVIGAGGAVVGELSYFKAIRDGRIDSAERASLAVIGRALRFAMLLVLIASFCLVVANYAYHFANPGVTAVYWMEMLLVLIIIWSTWALGVRRLTYAVGSGIAFAAWWYLALLDLGQIHRETLGSLVGYYIVAAAVMIGVLWYLRSLYSPRH